ncbi:IPT/TIG domain-containing protein [Myxococcus stipitatus]|uniref:IPT/TIG domain-containing protein n=1 Tax=Myxococcus stipitatus TaxID=83455 RepID=UPI001F2B1868|nr:IPT/TIG domain-containing protein [Myxococcus stipitatus]MCE9667785.1 IPT/TIG domain-containing protein [Myxococcus stipitatus]
MSRCPRSLLLVLSLLVVACGDDPAGTGPTLTAPTVREITPTGGPIAGNTLINVYGSGFQDGAKLYLGNQEALRTVVVNSFRIYGYSPTATTAQVDVRVVNPDGTYGVLVKGFTYEGPPAANIDQAEVLNGNLDTVSGGQPVGVLVRGAVTVAGLTRGVGQGGGVRAQAGFAAADADLLNQESYTWEEATYEKDSDSGEADVYKGNVLLQPAIGGESREWVIAMRFSIDGGKTWVLADGDGTANGISNDMLRRVFITRPRVDYCKLGPDGNRANPELFYKPGDTTLLKVLGQVYAAGITQGAGAGSGITAQLGMGPVDTDPRTSEAWTWINATYKAEHGNNDEWEAELPNPGVAGTYKLAFRFSISENAWRVCDADGVNDSAEGELAFNLAKLGTLTVGNDAPKPPIGWCKIGEDQKAPEAITYQTTQTSGLKTVYAQVYMQGVTDKVGAGPGLSGQLGWGPAGEDPRTSPLWNWTTALAFNKDNFEVNDEWKAALPNPGLNGEYRYAVRFSGNGGPVRVCDGNGVDDGGQEFELDQLGQLTVSGEVVVPKVIGYCKLGPAGSSTPESVTYATSAEATRKVVGQVYVQGVTTSTGAGTGVVGQLGYGPAGQDPATWTWVDAAYANDDGTNNDQYEATLPNPGTVGSYRFAYRFKVNDGAYLLCDADGANAPKDFDATKTGTLTVSAPQDISIGWCKLGGESDAPPPNEVYRVGQATKDIYAQVYMEGVTPGTGAGAGIQGQVGYGPVDQAPDSASWHWTSTGASFNRESGGGNNDEWKAALPNPGEPGQYKFAIRFNVNGGAYRYCDADGLNNGFSLEQAGNLEVKAVGVDSCQLVGPATLSATPGGATAVVRGKVLVTTVTDVTSGAGAGITSEVGYGPEGSDPATASGWSWKTASFAAETDSGAQDAYETALTAPAAEGTYAVAVRFRYQTGAWAYCDRDGSANGYQPAQASVLTVAEVVPPQVDWCRLGGEAESDVPSESYAADEAASTVIAVQVHEAGVTPGAGAGAGITAELGYGPSDSAHTGGAWQWVAATYAADTGNTQNDEYRATLPNPGTVGSYKFAYRVKLGTGPYVYCDANGTDDGFDVALAGKLTVLAGAPAVCRLQAVSGTTVGSGDAVTVTGRVRIPGVTSGNGEGAGIQVQVGLGNADVNASTTPASFTWKPAAYTREAPDEADTDEFGTTIHPAYEGNRAVGMRFSTDSGATWTYCDKDGSDVGGYTQGQQHALTVNKHQDIDYCNLQWPFSAASGTTIYGQVYEDGVTNQSGAGAGLTAQLGYGDAAMDPGVAGWTWVAAPYLSDDGNNDQFSVTLPDIVVPAGVTMSYAFRYSLDGGPFCYGDRNDRGGGGKFGDGFVGTNLGTVSNP